MKSKIIILIVLILPGCKATQKANQKIESDSQHTETVIAQSKTMSGTVSDINTIDIDDKTTIAETIVMERFDTLNNCIERKTVTRSINKNVSATKKTKSNATAETKDTTAINTKKKSVNADIIVQKREKKKINNAPILLALIIAILIVRYLYKKFKR